MEICEASGKFMEKSQKFVPIFCGNLAWDFFFRLVSYDILIWCLTQHICHLQRHFNNDITLQQNNITL